MSNLPAAIAKSLSPFTQILRMKKVKREFELSKTLMDELDSRSQQENMTPSEYLASLLDMSFMNYLRN